MHRNTYLLIICLAVFAALVIGVNLGKRLATPAPTTTPKASITPSPTGNTYTNEECGFTLSYPAILSLTGNATQSALLVHSTNKDESIAIACQEEIPRPPLTADNIESFMISSISATLYHDASAKDGTQIDELIFTHPTTGMDIFIAGFGKTFDSVIATVKLLP